MSSKTNRLYQTGLFLLALLALAACSSTSEPEAVVEPEPSVDANGSTATSSGAGDGDELTQEQIREQNALRQTVFYFDFDVAEFKSEDRETLTYHARNLAANPGRQVRLEGHADERGTREYNLALGERRANGILNYLIVNGAARSQIEVVSYGEEQPAATGQTESAWAQNRRVEVVNR